MTFRFLGKNMKFLRASILILICYTLFFYHSTELCKRIMNQGLNKLSLQILLYKILWKTNRDWPRHKLSY